MGGTNRIGGRGGGLDDGGSYVDRTSTAFRHDDGRKRAGGIGLHWWRTFLLGGGDGLALSFVRIFRPIGDRRRTRRGGRRRQIKAGSHHQRRSLAVVDPAI